MRSSINLGKLFGIPFGVNYTWFIIFVLVTVSLAGYHFPQTYPDWSRPLYWIIGIATSLLFFGSVLAHELCHSLVAIRFGIPVRNITLFLFGGVSTITREATKPGHELLMAFAGPASSLVLGGLFGLLYFLTRTTVQPIAALALYLAGINVLLGLFNLLPGFPLDGGRVFRAIVWGVTGNYEQSTRIAAVLGQGIAYLFIIGGILIAFTGNLLSGLWFAFIGWFLENAASQSQRQLVLRDYLRGYTAADVMRSDCATISGEGSVQQLVDQEVLPKGQRCFLVTTGGELRGIVTLHEIRGVPREDWPTTPVRDAMTGFDEILAVPPEEEAYRVLEKMDAEDVNQIPVVKDHRLVGVVARDSVLRFIRTRAELGH